MTSSDKHNPGTSKATDKLANESNTSLLPLVGLLARAAAKEFIAGSPATSDTSNESKTGETHA